jgi:hypothetical protein
MELLLNLGWVVVSTLMVCVWLRSTPSPSAASQGHRSRQLVALAVLVLILFPVISVTDDLQAVLNPAETDTALRRDHSAVAPHSILPAAAGLPIPAFAAGLFGPVRVRPQGASRMASKTNPSLVQIQNRPPPPAAAAV